MSIDEWTIIIMMAMAVSSTLILCFTLDARCEGFAFSLRSTYVREKGVNFNLK